MKVKHLFWGVLAIIPLAVTFACSNSFETESDSLSTNGELLKQELSNFGNKQYDLFCEAFYSTGTRGLSGLSTVKVDSAAVVEMENSVEKFCKNHDIFADLTPEQKKNLQLNKDSIEILTLDPEAFLEWAKHNKSNEYHGIISDIIVNNRTDFYPDDIINNEGLYLNEKVNLLTVLPALHSSFAVGQTRASKSYSNENAKRYQKCEEEYKEDKARCLAEYLISCGLSIAGGSATAGVLVGAGVAWSTYQYHECEENALNNFRQCKGK